MVISPIFYMGCKKKLIADGIINYFPRNIHSFVEPFAGSAIMSMNVKADSYYLSDMNPHLIELYNLYATTSADTIIQAVEANIKKYGLALERTKRNVYKDTARIEEYKQAYISLRDSYNKSRNTIDFLTLCFYAFSQQFRFNFKGEFNMPCGNDFFSEKNREYIKNGCDFFSQKNVHIAQKDFSKVDVSKDSFVYLDPPYLGTVASYNENNGWTSEDDSRLWQYLKDIQSCGASFAMSEAYQSDSTEYVDLCNERKYFVTNFGLKYTACGKGLKDETQEVLITSYKPDVHTRKPLNLGVGL